MPRVSTLCFAICLPVLAGCANGFEDFDFDLRPGPISTRADAVTAARPTPDANGLITYESYQVAVARRGDTVADVAARIGIDTEELARFNGRTPSDPLLPDEVLALPRRVTPSAGAPRDIAAIASGAIAEAEAAAGTSAAPSQAPTPVAAVAVQDGQEPVRHRVDRGETAFSIARLYGVSVGALAEWNGLGPDLAVREGQYLLIPLVIEEASARPTQAEPPGRSTAPLPPSAAAPLPEAVPAATLPPVATAPARAPEPAAAPAAPSARFVQPVDGSILRGYGGGNEGIDIAAATGTPVRVVDDGQVAAITQSTDQIPILVVRHSDGLLTVYANIQNISVARGDRVSRGQTVGEVGPGDPAFLHFEVRRGMQAVNPAELLP